MEPTVSVIVTCYNKAPYIEETLDSVRTQTFQDLELIVIEDASTDRSIDIIRRWKMKHSYTKCRIIHNHINRHVCASLNLALSEARGKYIAFLDGDDIFEPEKLEIQVAKLDNLSSDYATVISDAYMIDENGVLQKNKFMEIYNPHPNILEGDLLTQLISSNFFCFSASLVRKECIDRIKGFDEALIYQDWDFWIRIAQFYKFSYINKPLARYRIVEHSNSKKLSQKKRRRFSNYHIIQKLLKNPHLSDSQRQIAYEMQYITALEIYKSQDEDRGVYLKKALSKFPTLKGYICLIMAYFLPNWLEKKIVKWRTNMQTLENLR